MDRRHFLKLLGACVASPFIPELNIPIEMKLNALFKQCYGDKISELLPSSPIMKVLKCPGGELYHQPIILGLEHGVTFK